MPFETTIADFAAALADRSAPPPAVTRGRLGAPDARRFAVYRNNIAVGLIGALEARYPVTRRIVGPEPFRAMARAFASARKPHTPVMIDYGEDFPDFLAGCLAADAAGPDMRSAAEVARLENAWVEAYHAKDSPVATIDDLRGIDPADLADARIEFHPAARTLRFSTPAASLWALSQDGPEPSEAELEGGEDALVTRPDAEVLVRVLPPGGYEFAARLKGGAALLGAAESASVPGFDFGAHLLGLVQSGAVGAILMGDAR